MTKGIKLYQIKVETQSQAITDLSSAVQQALSNVLKSDRFSRLSPGANIAITAGSRGIKNYVKILSIVTSEKSDRSHVVL